MELLLLIPIVAITAFVTARLVRRRHAGESRPADANTRVDALESTVERLQQELSETQERLDFAERMLTKARDERRLGS